MASLRRLKHVNSFIDRHGRVRHYFRRNGISIALPGLPGSDEFMAAYATALGAAPAPVGKKLRSSPGSIAAAVADYLGSHAFRALAAATQKRYRADLEKFRAELGERQLDRMPREIVGALLDKLSSSVSRRTLNALRGMFVWAVEERKILKVDPTFGLKVKTGKADKSDGFHTWSEAEIARFEAHHPVGSKPRLALALGLYTAQRRADVLRMARQHIRNGVLPIRQQKTGRGLDIPVHPELQRIIDASPAGPFTFLVDTKGKPFKGEYFSECFRQWCDEAGLPSQCTFHGLRKAACRRLAEAGASVHQIMAISGHRTLKEIARYTQAVEQARLAQDAMELIGDDGESPRRRAR
jgi:integrase